MSMERDRLVMFLILTGIAFLVLDGWSSSREIKSFLAHVEHNREIRTLENDKFKARVLEEFRRTEDAIEQLKQQNVGSKP